MSEGGFEALAAPSGLSAAASTAEWISQVCAALRSARAALLDRSAADSAVALGRVGSRFLDPVDPLRREALERLPDSAGFSAEMARVVLDGMAADWTGPRLAGLLDAELGGGAALDGFVPSARVPGVRARALGPALCVQIVAGSVPGVGVSALLRSLLVKAPTLLKPGRGDLVLPELFARGLAEADRTLASALAVVYWPGGSRVLEGAALARAEVVTAYGSDETVADVRARVPAAARFVGYHHRVSIGVVGRDALHVASVGDTASQVARSIALFEQRGCVSPQLVFVEEGGAVAPVGFAEAVADALATLERELPSARLDAGRAAALHQGRGTAEMLAGSGEGRVLHGGGAPWTVLYDAGEPAGRGSGLSAGRVARVRPLPSLDALPERLAPLAAHLQSVGVAGFGDRGERLAEALARAGAVRVAPFASLPFPPPWWHHDGRGPLTDLVRWVDLEPE